MRLLLVAQIYLNEVLEKLGVWELYEFSSKSLQSLYSIAK